jgi:hypothetical protein
MAVDVLSETVIACLRREGAAFAAEPDNAPKWYVNIKSAAWVTEPPLRVGSRFAFAAEFLGKRMEYTYEVVEWVPDERLVMRTAEGPFPMETTYTWSDAGEGVTRMTLRNRGEPAGFSKLMAPMMAGAMRKANTEDLARLKRFPGVGINPPKGGQRVSLTNECETIAIPAKPVEKSWFCSI